MPSTLDVDRLEFAVLADRAGLMRVPVVAAYSNHGSTVGDTKGSFDAAEDRCNSRSLLARGQVREEAAELLTLYQRAEVEYDLRFSAEQGTELRAAVTRSGNHPQKYQEIHGGPGPQALSASAQAWSSHVGGKFDSIAQRLEEATAKAGVAWEGAAAEAHGNSTAPLSSFVRDAKDVSTAVGTSTEHQVDNYTGVRDSMPEPKKVTATDSLLEKGGAWLVGSQTDLQRQEQEAMQRAQEAQRIYGTYDTGSGNVSSSLPHYPEAPKMQYTDQSGGGGGGRVGIDTGGGYTGSNVSNGGGTYSGGGSGSAGTGSGVGSSVGGTGGSSGVGSGSGGSTDGSDGPPAGSDSAWTTPPTTGGPAPVPPGAGYGHQHQWPWWLRPGCDRWWRWRWT